MRIYKIQFERLSLRAANILKNNNILTHAKLENYFYSDRLLELHGSGEKFLAEISNYLENENNLIDQNSKSIDIDFVEGTKEFSKFSVRTKRILNLNDINSIDQLALFYYSGKLAKAENAGIKVVEEIKKFLDEIDFKIDEKLFKNLNFEDIPRSSLLKKEAEFIEALGIKSFYDFLSLPIETLSNIKTFKAILKKLPNELLGYERNFTKISLTFKDVWKIALIDVSQDQIRRDNVSERVLKGITLEKSGELGGEDSISRERVRQLESRFKNSLNLFLNPAFREIKEYVEQRGIFSVIELEMAIPSLKGITQLAFASKKQDNFFNFIFENSEDFFSYFFEDADIKILKKDSLSIDELFYQFIEYILSIDRLHQSLEETFHGFCIINNRQDLSSNYSVFLNHLSKKNAAVIARIFLSEYRLSNSIIELKNFMSFIDKSCPDHSIDLRRLENILAEEIKGLYLLSKRRFIFYKDIALTNTQINFINHCAVSLIQTNPNRSFSLENVLTKIKTELIGNIEFDENDIEYLDPYVLNTLLSHRSNEIKDIKDVGRLQWTAGTIKKRTEIYPAAVSALKKYGKPMTNTQLKDEINSIRGVHQFQLHTTKTSPDIIKLDDGSWGLRNRDIDLSDDIEQRFLEELINYLNSKDGIICPKDFDQIRLSVGIKTDISNEVLLNILRRHIPSGGRRSNPIFLMKKSSQFHFLIYLPSIDEAKAQEIYSSEENSFWDMEAITRFLIDKLIFSEEDYDQFILKKSTESKFLPQSSLYLHHYANFCGFGMVREMSFDPSKTDQYFNKFKAKRFSSKNFWEISKIEDFFVENKIFTQTAFRDWRKLGKPEKEFIPSELSLSKRGFCGWIEIQNRLGISDTHSKKIRSKSAKVMPNNFNHDPLDKRKGNFWSMDKIVSFFIEENILKQSDFLEWRKKDLPEKKFIPASRALFEKGFPGWKKVKEICNEKDS